MPAETVAFVFARGGSKGVPGKNIRPLAGKPLIAHAIATGLATPGIDRVVVSTDDEAIAAAARAAGAEVPFMRPVELARDSSPEWLAWRHAIEELNRLDPGRPVGTFVSLPATSPLRAVEDVTNCLDVFRRGDSDVVITVRPAARSPYFNMIRADDAGYAEIAVRPPAAIARRQDAPKLYDITTVAYVARPDFIVRANGIFEGRVRFTEVPEDRSLDIDTEYDFELAEFLIGRRKDGRP